MCEVYVCACVRAGGRRQSEEAEPVTRAARRFPQEINNCSDASGDGALIALQRFRAVIT